MSDTVNHALRKLAEALPPGSAMSVPREWVLELVDCGQSTAEPSAGTDRLLTAEEVAERLQLSVEVVYRKARQWPFTRKLGRKALRFSEEGLNRWLDRRR